MTRIVTIVIALAAVCWSGRQNCAQAGIDVGETAKPPFTSLEQAGRLAAVTRQGFGRGLHPRSLESIVPQRFFQRDYRAQWMDASRFERTLLAERIGNQGRARFASERGWTKLLGSQHRGIRQGPDALLWDSSAGRLYSLESKGGTSRLMWSYGSRQGTNTNSLRSAEFVLRSLRSSRAEKLANAQLVVAARWERLNSGVVCTPHKLGYPEEPRFFQSIDDLVVAQEARLIQQRLVRTDPLMGSLFREAERNVSLQVWKHRVVRHGLPGLGLAGAVLTSLDAVRQTRSALTMFQDPALRSTPRPYLHSGIAVGQWGETSALALDAAAGLGLLKEGWMLSGRSAGRWFLPIAASVEGLILTTAYYELSHGHIGHREFYRRSTGPTIFLTFASGGAAIGVWAGGVGALPGATIGALIALPVQYIAGWAWDRSDERLSEAQRKAVNVAVARRYGLSP